jgi:hypothetical protein
VPPIGVAAIASTGAILGVLFCIAAKPTASKCHRDTPINDEFTTLARESHCSSLAMLIEVRLALLNWHNDGVSWRMVDGECRVLSGHRFDLNASEAEAYIEELRDEYTRTAQWETQQ